MVCNADEGDPGAWVNRMTLENDPHALIEGMVIGGWAAGADARLHLHPRGVPAGLRAHAARPCEQAYEQGLLGKDILGSDFTSR